MNLSGLVAYPSRPEQVGSTIRIALESLRADGDAQRLTTWEELDVYGRFIATTILGAIEKSEVFVADVTQPNFNVTFEVGFAIGQGKPVALIRHSALRSSPAFTEVGVFDTLGYQPYQNSQQLADFLSTIDKREPLPIGKDVTTKSPVYLLMPKVKTDPEIRVQSRIKKVRLPFRTFDPEEHGRLPAGEAIDQVARSHAVIVPLISGVREGSDVHNLRAAFVAGLAMGLDKVLLLLQEGDDPVPLDYRDLVRRFKFPEQIDEYVAEVASQVTERVLASSGAAVVQPRTFLEKIDLGASSAENELHKLAAYYLETDEFHRTHRGEVNIVTGRKGSGKTAMFARLRDRLRRERHRIVLDLKPEGFQLLKFKERVLDHLEAGTREHTITAFWEYLLLLETCHKILQKDSERHLRDERLYGPYRELATLYGEDEEAAEGDFSERMLRLTQRIADAFGAPDAPQARLASGKITELIHRHDVAALRDNLVDYLEYKSGLWILFDNLDKGWPAHGVTDADVLTLRCLLDAIGKIERMMRRKGIDCHGVVFLRNDVYELLLAATPDRGKVAHVLLDWTDPNLLREVVRKRLVQDVEGEPSFDEIWPQICVSHYGSEESSQYIIERSLMRPRGLLDFIQSCRSHAVNMRHGKIEMEDIEQGEENYSAELLINIGFELQDIMPEARDVLYEFVEEAAVLPRERVRELTEQKVGNEWEKLLDLFLWYGFLGIARSDGAVYIYDVRYDHLRLQALAAKRDKDRVRYVINPAFWSALEVSHGDAAQINLTIEDDR